MTMLKFKFLLWLMPKLRLCCTTPTSEPVVVR